MENKKGTYGIVAIIAAIAVLICYLLTRSGATSEKPLLTPVVNSIAAKAINLAWEKVPEVDSVEIKWRGPKGQPLGRMVTIGNQVLIRPEVSGEQMEISLTPYADGKAKNATVMYLMSGCELYKNALYRSDSIGTVDIILFALTQAPAGSVPSGLCNLCPSSQMTDEYCDGTWFDTGYPASDQYYKITARGTDGTGNPVSIAMIIRAAPSGAVHYIAAGSLVPCSTVSSGNLTSAGSFLVYDDGTLSFEVHGDEKSFTPLTRGVFLQNLRNVMRFEVEKLNPCSPPG